MYTLRFAESVAGDIKKLSAFYRNQVLDAIEEQLVRQPTVSTKNRKRLENLVPPWPAVPPIWELRVGDYRVFYDVAEDEKIVYIRAVREKPAGLTTKEIL